MSLAGICSPDCYACLGTGLQVGFGARPGQRCPAIEDCRVCGCPIPHADYDEGAPRRVDGLPACEECWRLDAKETR